MQRRIQIALAFVLLAILCVVCWKILQLRGPRYHGRALISWLEQLDHRDAGPQLRVVLDENGNLPLSPSQKEAAEAIRKIGTDGLPFLLEELTNTDSQMTTLLRRMRWRRFEIRPPPASRLWRRAAMALTILGPAGKSAIPALERALNEPNQDDYCRYENIGLVLGSMGPDGWAVLTRGLANTNWLTRWASALGLEQGRGAGPGTVEALLDCARTNASRGICIRALGKIGQKSELVVPFLITELQQTNGGIDRDVLEALGRFGPRARCAVPALLEIIHGLPRTNLALQEIVRWLPRTNTSKLPVIRQGYIGITNEINWTLKQIDPDVAVRAEKEWIPLGPAEPAISVEQWLALGKGTESHLRGAALSEWLALQAKSEPTYSGRNLSEWLLDPEGFNLLEKELSDLQRTRETSRQAVRAIGTNAIPWLLSWLQAPGHDTHRLARRGFRFLGSAATPALPALVQIAGSSSAESRTSSYRCMTAIDPAWETIWPALVSVLHSPDADVRMAAALWLIERYPDQAQAAGVSDLVPRSLRPDATR